MCEVALPNKEIAFVYNKEILSTLEEIIPESTAIAIREAGEGRYDIALFPKEEKLSGIIIELKVQKNCDAEELQALAQDALQQINVREYDVQMREQKISRVLKYGVVFSGKQVEIAE